MQPDAAPLPARRPRRTRLDARLDLRLQIFRRGGSRTVRAGLRLSRAVRAAHRSVHTPGAPRVAIRTADGRVVVGVPSRGWSLPSPIAASHEVARHIRLADRGRYAPGTTIGIWPEYSAQTDGPRVEVPLAGASVLPFPFPSPSSATVYGGAL